VDRRGKGDRVQEGQVLVRLEDEEFRASYDRQKARWIMRGLIRRTGTRIAAGRNSRAQHNLDEARATLMNDKLTLDRTKELSAEE